MDTKPHLSVVVPVHNARGTIADCLGAIRASTFEDYELIVVDDASDDTTPAIAEELADRLIRFSAWKGRIEAFRVGVGQARGDIIVRLDSDVVVRPSSLSTIAGFLDGHPEVDAVTGLLARDHPNEDFFSQYKNLYMHFIFRDLPSRVSFLYGSLCAMRREVAQLYDPSTESCDDTAFGQELVRQGKQIAFLRDLEVVHLKRYSALSLARNDFLVPFGWARIWLSYAGWKQFGAYETGFAHSPVRQIASVILVPVTLVMLVVTLLHDGVPGGLPLGVLSLGWLCLNGAFLFFLVRERGLLFGALALPVTLLDHLIMATGIVCGAAATLARGRHA